LLDRRRLTLVRTSAVAPLTRRRSAASHESLAVVSRPARALHATMCNDCIAPRPRIPSPPAEPAYSSPARVRASSSRARRDGLTRTSASGLRRSISGATIDTRCSGGCQSTSRSKWGTTARAALNGTVSRSTQWMGTRRAFRTRPTTADVAATRSHASSREGTVAADSEPLPRSRRSKRSRGQQPERPDRYSAKRETGQFLTRAKVDLEVAGPEGARQGRRARGARDLE